MKTVAVVNQKGGVGKTTTACNLSAAFGRLGRRVLAVDLDPQAHLTLHFGQRLKDGEPSVYDVLVRGCPASEALRATSEPGVALLPSHIDLSSAELELASEIGRETILRAALAEVAGRFDLALIDCPPSLGLLCLNGLTAADEVLIPLQAEFFALHGISRLHDVIQLLHRRLRRGPELLGIVLCRYARTTRLAREVRDDVESHFGGVVLDTIIRQNVRLAEASSFGQTVFQYDDASPGAEDYRALAQELLRIGERRGLPAQAAEGAAAPAPGTGTAAAG